MHFLNIVHDITNAFSGHHHYPSLHFTQEGTREAFRVGETHGSSGSALGLWSYQWRRMASKKNVSVCERCASASLSAHAWVSVCLCVYENFFETEEIFAWVSLIGSRGEAVSWHLHLIFGDNKSGLFLNWRASTKLSLSFSLSPPIFLCPAETQGLAMEVWNTPDPLSHFGWPDNLSCERSFLARQERPGGHGKRRPAQWLSVSRGAFRQTCEPSTAEGTLHGSQARRYWSYQRGSGGMHTPFQLPLLEGFKNHPTVEEHWDRQETCLSKNVK